MNSLIWLLKGSLRGRISLFLWRSEEKSYTSEEIANGMTDVTKQRIQQMLQKMTENEVLDREIRKTNRPGPNPYEYQLSRELREILDKELDPAD